MSEQQKVSMPIEASERVRVSFFGRLHLSYRTEEGTWQDVEPEEWGETAHARRLLSFLVFHGRRAGRGILMDQLWPANDSPFVDVYLSRAASALRKVLQSETLLQLNSRRTIYQLADQSLIWTDIDAYEVAVKAAERVGPTSAEGCQLLGKAQDYAQRGRLLEDNDDRWCYARRDEIETSLYRVHLWLAEGYEAQGQLREAEKQLEILLRNNDLDAMVLSRLLVVLAKQGFTAQALQRYTTAVACATTQGVTLPSEMKVLATRLQQSPEIWHRLEIPVLQADTSAAQHSLPETSLDVKAEEEPSVALLKREAAGIATIPWEIFTFPPQTLFSSTGSVIFDLKRAGMLMIVEQWYGRAGACGTLQAILAQEIAMFDHLKTLYQSDTYRISRRQTLGALVALPTALIAALQHGPMTASLVERFLPHCAAAITSCWHLINEGDFATVHLAISSYLPSLEIIAQQSDPYRATAAHLAAQGYLLAALVAHHRGSHLERKAFSQKAVEYAQGSNDYMLFVVAQRSLATTLRELKWSTEALPLFQKIESESNGLFPLLRSDILMKFSTVYAQMNERQKALRCISEARDVFPEPLSSEMPIYISGDFGFSSLIIGEGKTYLELGQHTPDGEYYEQAEKVFTDGEKLADVPERFRLEIINYRAETALHLGRLEAFVAYMEQGIQGAQALGSQKRLDEVKTLYREVRKPTHSWHNENRVRDLADLLVS